MGRFERRMRGDSSQGLPCRLLLGPPTGRPGSIQGSGCRDKLPPNLHSSLQRWPTMRRRAQAGLASNQAHRSGRPPCAPGAHRPARSGAQHTSIKRGSRLGGARGCSRVHASLAGSPDCRLLSAMQGEAAAGSLASGRPAITSSWRRRQGLMGSITRLVAGRASLRADCRVSPAGRGGGDLPAAAPLSWAKQTARPTPRPPPGAARRGAVALQGCQQPVSSRKRSGLQLVSIGQTAAGVGAGNRLRRSGHRRAGQPQCWLPAQACP